MCAFYLSMIDHYRHRTAVLLALQVVNVHINVMI